MKFKIPTEGGDEEINMAPMIDMVFLLLIFFMVASHLTALERIPVELPVADKAKVPKEARDRQMITLKPAANASSGVEIYMNLKQVELDELGDALKEMLAENENLQMFLRADRQVHHKHIKAIMQTCSDIGIPDIIFATFESGN